MRSARPSLLIILEFFTIFLLQRDDFLVHVLKELHHVIEVGCWWYGWIELNLVVVMKYLLLLDFYL
jgi:hypothetical protein